MSPAYSEDKNAVFTWLGIIHYIPTHDKEKRDEIAQSFYNYSRMLDKLCDKYDAVGHWAKIETSNLNENDKKQLKERLIKKYGSRLELFKKYRKEFDPKNLLTNHVIESFIASDSDSNT